MGFVVPSSMPPVPRDMSAPAQIRASTMLGLLLRDRFTFATSRRALLQLWPIASVTSAAFVVIAGSKVRLLATSNGNVRITHAAFAVANPISGDFIRMTNRDWEFSTEEVRRTLGLTTLLIVNDFTALAMALPGL